MPPTLKLVKDLLPGDCVLIDRNQVVTVKAVVPSVQNIRKKVILATFKDQNNREIHRTYLENSTVRIQPSDV